MNADIQKYIDGCRAAGMADDLIKRQLLDSGWQESHVAEHFTAAPVQAPSAATVPAGVTVKAYDPNGYAVIAFFLGFVPVFVMSMANVKALSLPSTVAQRMKAFLGTYVACIVAYIGAIAWAAWMLTVGLQDLLRTDPVAYLRLSYGGMNALAKAMPANVAYAKIILSNGSTGLFVINLILLVLAVRFANTTERAAYMQAKKSGSVIKRGAALPVFIGIAFMLALYFLPTAVISLVSKIA